MSNTTDVITAIGAAAEMTSVFYNTLRKAKLPRKVCRELTKEFVSATMQMSEQKKG